MQSDVRLLAGFNPSLLMIESDSANPVPVDDLLIMKHWLAAQLLWDPSLDPEALQKEFVKKYYGPSAPLIERYLALRTAAAAHSTVYTSTFEYTAAWLDSDSLFTGLALLNSAEESVDDPVIIRRIELLKKPLEYMLIANFDQLRGLSGCPEYAKVRKSAECYLAFLDRCQVGFEGSTRTIDNTRGKLERFIAFPPVRSQEPVFLRQFQGRRMIIAEENAFVIWNGTAYGEIIPDPLAANGWTIKLKNAATWSVQLPIRRDFNLNKEYDIYAACRLDPASLPAGGRYFLGGYDSARLESYIGFYADASTLTDMEYRYLSLGTHRLREKGYLFFDSNLRAETPCSYLNHLVFVEK
ncbi:hypothetical protein SDC9_88515 [bioreactor metagenome]|uniref:Uncharacterized protein n=1 Tax=bioreactor metagenome TaxID=1076179 RepID=A0A644ZLT1_9ZZZZ